MITEDSEPIHGWFNLSYSSHLVLDPARTRLLAADDQQLLEKMLDRLDRSFPDVNPRGDQVVALAGTAFECGGLSEDQMTLIGMVSEADDCWTGDCDHDSDDEDDLCDGGEKYWYDWRGDQHSDWESVVVPDETEQQARDAGRRVVSRTLLQSMPADWQQRFVEILSKLDQIDVDVPESYDIRFYTAAGVRTTDPVPHYNRGRTQLVPTVVAP